MTGAHRTAVVLIGRNEGDRLVRALASLGGRWEHVVYVDSGSTDDSVRNARAVGAVVVELSSDQPFTAARARNAGVIALMQRASGLDFVQFMDGDCELNAAWVPRAMRFLDAQPDVAVACGRRRERNPVRSIFNRMCDWEWDTPVGEARTCGGDALVRIRAFTGVGGFDPTLIAGEEPELCVRLRRAGWRIWRLDAEMTLHDAAMIRLSQWWRRSMRGGHARAEGMVLHGRAPEWHGVRACLRALFWGLAVPSSIIASVALWGAAGLCLLGLYPLQIMRLAVRQGFRARTSWQRACLLVAVNFAEVAGMFGYWLSRLERRPRRLIEYK